MRAIKLRDLLSVTATPQTSLRQLRYRNQVALAFGRSDAYDSLKFFEIDALAVVLADTLTKSHGRSTAARLVRTDCDRWCEAAAMVEATWQPAFYVVADFRGIDGKLAHLTATTSTGDIATIAAVLAGEPQTQGLAPVRITAINVLPLMQVLIKTAAAHGIDLTAPWLPPLGSDAFRALFAPYSMARNSAVDAVRARREAKAGPASRAIFEARLQ